MATPNLSVILVTYEQLEVTSLVIDSLSRQTYCDVWELIVCDDGSESDIRARLAKTTLGKNVNVRYIWQPNIGRRVARSRNNGIRCAQGKILVFLDGDSVVPPDFLAAHHQAHEQSSQILYCGSRRLVFSDPLIAIPTNAEHFLKSIKGPPPIVDFPSWQKSVVVDEPWRACMACNMSVSRSDAIWFNEFFIGWGAEDVELACRLVRRHSFEVSLEPAMTVYSVEHCEARLYSVIRPSSHREICDCLHDIFHLEWMYPDVELSSIVGICRYFDFDHKLRSWKRASSEVFSSRSTEDSVRMARTWIAEVERRHAGNEDPRIWAEHVRALALHRGLMSPLFRVRQAQ